MSFSMVAGMAMAIVTGLTWVVVGVVSSGTARRGANYALVAWAIHAIFRSGPRRLAAPWPEFRAALLGALTITVVNTAVSYFLFYPCMDRLADAGAGAIAHPLMVGACFCGFFIYSAFFLRERTTALQKIGFAVGLAGVAL